MSERPMKRALLIWNPVATTTTPGVRDVIARALSSELHVEVAETAERGHATDLASEAAGRGEVDLVAVLGGDGTINEVVNALAGTGVPLATIPGGGTNVLARTLGFPKDAVEATALLLRKIRDGATPKTISLGRVNGRAFAFAAGAGFDAEIVRAVEANPRAKRRLGEAYFVLSGLREYFAPSRRPRPSMTLRFEGHAVEGVRIAVCGNSDPFTFLGKRPFRVVPGASIERDSLDVTAVRTLRLPSILRILFSSFGRARHPGFKHVVALRDLSWFELHADRPVPYQVDGDLAGEAAEFRFWSEPGSLRVIS